MNKVNCYICNNPAKLLINYSDTSYMHDDEIHFIFSCKTCWDDYIRQINRPDYDKKNNGNIKIESVVEIE